MNAQVKSILSLLPPIVYRSVANVERLTEIRIRKDRHISVIANGRNIICEYITDGEFIKNAVMAFCKGSLYSHMDTICKGYIALENGYRIGVCGSAVTENGIVKSVNDITSVCIRIPTDHENISLPLFRRIQRNGYCDSILVYSPPGVGKTTVLRDLCEKLAVYPSLKRVSIIDTRREIATEKLRSTDNIDILSGYPKAEGIMIATRTMNPEYIICDEIGGYDEALSLLAVQNCGVPIIASAHAKSVCELLNRSNIKLLHDNRLFSAYVSITRDRVNYGQDIFAWTERNSV